MKTVSLLTKVLLFSLLTSAAHAEVIFEGYYKLSLNGEHIGYFIQRYDLDSAKKTFSSVYYVFTKTADGTTTESLNAKATTALAPVSYQYTRLENNKTKAIDAVVKKNKLILKIVEDGKSRTKETGITDKTFFSTFLAHLMLKNPNGIQIGNKFTYEAIAEEDGSLERGEAYVKEQGKERGLDTFRTLNTFKKEEFVNWVNFKGESIKTLVPKLNLTAELVANPKEAYGTLPFNESSVKLLFGNIPTGKNQLLNRK